MAEPAPARVVCIGGAVVDRKLHLFAPVVPATSNPARSVTTFGGVARNVVENLLRLGLDVALVSRVGADDAGTALVRQLAELGADVGGVTVVPGAATAQYVAVLDPGGELVIGIADMAVLDGLGVAAVAAGWPGSGADAARWVVADCNLPAEALAEVLRRGRRGTVTVVVDAVSTPKVVRLPADLAGIGVLFCNLGEARALLAGHGRDAEGDPAQLALRLHTVGAAAVVLTLGAGGAVLADPDGVCRIPAAQATVVDVTGAGDALVAGTVDALARGQALSEAVVAGTLVAARTVQSRHSVVAEQPRSQ